MTTQTTPTTSSRSSNAKPGGGSALPARREVLRPPRRYGQWAGTVLFLLIAMLVAGWLWQHKSDRVEVLVVRTPVAAGDVVARSDLGTAEVAGVSEAVRVGDVDAVVGRTAAVGLLPGQVLTPAMVTERPVPGPGERVVGLQLDATRTPADLTPGTTVEVLAVPPSGDPSSPSGLSSPHVLAQRAVVQQSGQVDGGDTRLSLVLPKADANRVAAFGAAGRIAVVQTPLGGDR